MTLYRLRDLTMIFGDRTVLDIPEMDLEKGRIIALMGPNGAGKTTLLEILSFLVPPTGGNIEYDGRPVDFSAPARHALRRDVVMVAQTPIMFSATVYKNVEFGLKVRRLPGRRRGRIVNEMLELVGMRSFSAARADTLSGGETQRVAIARALACGPKVIFFDEPTASVDIEHQIGIENIIRAVNVSRDISVVLTTHNMLQAAKLADRTVFLFNGRPAASVYENIYTATVEPEGGDMPSALILNRIRVPLPRKGSGRVKLALDPKGMKPMRVESEAPDRECPGTDWSGRVLQITGEGRFVRVLVDVGIPLSLLLSAEAYRVDPFLIGDEIRVLCPPEAVEMM